MKLKRWIGILILFFSVFFFNQRFVSAYSYVHDSCLDSGSCLLACNYTVSYKSGSNTATRNISLYYNHSGDWKLMWQSTTAARTIHTKKGSLSHIFSDSGENVYPSGFLKESTFTCPKYGYLDLSDLNSDNELCFDNDGTTCAKKYSNLGTSFGKAKSKFISSVNDSNFLQSLQKYFSSWSFRNLTCEELVAKASTLPAEINTKLRTDLSTNYLKGHDVPTFIENSKVYKNAANSTIKAFEKKRTDCKNEINSNDSLTEEEREEQTNALDNIDTTELKEEIQRTLDKINVEVHLEGLNQKQTCEGIFGVTSGGEFQKESFGWLIQKLLNYIKIAGPILVILFSMFEFAKAIVSSDDEAMKKVQSRFVIRLIAVLALFLLPYLVGEALKLINGISNPTCYFK